MKGLSEMTYNGKVVRRMLAIAVYKPSRSDLLLIISDRWKRPLPNEMQAFQIETICLVTGVRKFLWYNDS